MDPGTVAYSETAMRNLRPLSIGKMLDRAFTICFKNFVPFLSLVAVVVIPQLILSYFSSRDLLSTMNDAFGTLSTGGADTASPTVLSDKILQAETNAGPYFLALSLLGLLFVPLSNAAVVSGVSRAYLGLPVRFAQCYGDAVRRWPALIGLMLIWLAVVMIAVMTVLIAFFIVGAALGVIAGFLGIVGTIVAVIIGIAAGLTALLFTFQLYLAAAYSFVTVVLEGSGPIVACGSGFARVFGAGQFWRSLGIAASLFGIILGLYLVGAVVGGITIALTRSFSMEFVVSGLVGAFGYPFLFAVVAVSYYDVRIRREGFDLQMLAAQLGAPASHAP